MGPEARYQKKLMDALRARGAWVVKYPAGPHGTIGTPDLLACYRGRFLAIEVKAGNPKLKAYAPTPMQRHQLGLVSDAGGIILIAWPQTHDDVMRVLRTIDDLYDVSQ